MFHTRFFSVIGIILFIAIFVCPALAGVGQVWMNTYNGPQEDGKGMDVATRIVKDQAGNVYAAGNSDGPEGNQGMAVVKYQADGSIVWVRRYDIPYSAGVTQRVHLGGIAIDQAGNVFMAGTAWNNGTYTFVLIKYQPDGNLSWVDEFTSDEYPHEWVNEVLMDNNGNLLVCGGLYIEHPMTYLLVKFSPNGERLWTSTLEGLSSYLGNSHCMTLDNSGNAYCNVNDKVAKIDGDGNTVWVHTYPFVMLGPIALDHAGNVYAGGTAPPLNEADEFNLFIVKIANDGSELWTKYYQSPLLDPSRCDDHMSNLAIDPSDNVIVTSRSSSDTTYEDYLTLKFTDSGDLLWERRYGAVGWPYGLAIDPSGNIFLSGSGFTDWAALGYSPSGELIWRHVLAGGTGEELVADGSGNIYLAGGLRSAPNVNDNDFLAIRYTPIPFPQGDASGDGLCNVGDAVYLINHVFKSGPAPDIAGLADANCDGRVNVGDVVFLINHIFKGAPAPADCVPAR